MAAVLNFFVSLAPFIFGLLFLGAIFGIRGLVRSRSELRGTSYGLEQEIARRHFRQAITSLVLVVVFTFLEFILIVFLNPNIPARAKLTTPTMNPLQTPSNTFELEFVQTSANTTPASPPTAQSSGCIPGQIDITSPKPGDQIQGLITLQGSASIPNFGFYKYEFAPAGSDNWATIVANNQTVQDGSLGNWDTSAITTGDYRLRLVVTDNQGNALPACVVPLRIQVR